MDRLTLDEAVAGFADEVALGRMERAIGWARVAESCAIRERLPEPPPRPDEDQWGYSFDPEWGAGF